MLIIFFKSLLFITYKNKDIIIFVCRYICYTLFSSGNVVLHPIDSLVVCC